MSLQTAFLFPGQGAQQVGMGADAYAGSPAARAVFDETDSVLGTALSRLILDGPADELVRSHNAQPAILCVSIALLRAAEEQLGTAMPMPIFAAGHSLGEYTALVATGSLSLAEGLSLVRHRGDLMQSAAEQRVRARQDTNGEWSSPDFRSHRLRLGGKLKSMKAAQGKPKKGEPDSLPTPTLDADDASTVPSHVAGKPKGKGAKSQA